MILTLLLQVAAAPVAPAAPASPPNIVLIISDDQAWTDFGFMGHDVIRTPRLDQLARESAFFPHGYVPTSLCRSSLATMITGLYPHQHGLTGNDPPKGVDRERMLAHIASVETLPKILGRAGYASLQTGKWWEGNCTCGGFTEGMTHGDPARGGRHGDEGLAIGRKTMAPIFTFLDECAESETPFFLWYAPFLPHSPHNPPARLLAKYEQAGRPLPIAKYMAMCEWFDETCGTVLDALDERGLAENTLVLFASDNGWIQRPDARGFAPRSKRTPYEAGVRTPILVRWPGVVTPGVHDVPVSTIDLAPTVLAACGADVPEAMPGASLLDVGEDGAPERGPVFGESFTHDVVDVNEPARSLLARWVVDGRWKLVHTSAPEPRLELFDLAEDPHETNELSAAHPERVAALSQAIDDWWPGSAPARPNVLFLLTDDQRADALGSAGHPFLATPSLDGLAARGVRFTNAFVTTSICAASRASILTSLHERAHGYTFGTPPITDRIAKDSYPSLLRAAGYRTGFVGKWGVKVGKSARAKMFDVFRPLGTNPYMKERPDGTVRHLTDITADEAIAFLRSSTPGKSFCLSVSFNAPHAEDGDPRQYIWPPALDGLYDDAEIPPPPLAEPEFFDAQPEFLRESMGRERWGWRFDNESKRVDMTRGYYRMITGVDRAIGRILAALDELDLADDTVVIFSSDNGYFLGERGFAGKWLIYEESVRVPLVVFDPRAAADQRGKTVDAMALNVDIAPTILALADVESPASYQGRSLLPVLRGEDPPWREDFFYEHLFDNATIPKSRGVRGERWVYVQYFEEEPVHEELYDLAADPHEAHDLARDPEHADILRKMRARCDELAAEREPIAAWGPPPDEDRFELATLASGLDKPLELTVAPDGRVFFIEQGGRVAVYRPDVGAVVEAAHFSVFTEQENGLLGLALDPGFAENGWLYLMRSPRHYSGQWISRFTVVGDVLDLDSEQLVFAFEEQRDECCHHAGSLEFGPDGELFIATGDNTNPFGSNGYAPIDGRDGRSPWDGQKGPANTFSYSGKVLRIRPTADGGYVIPAGNLFTDRAEGHPEIYAMGCRNPWRISVDSETGTLYWGDVGPDAGGDSERGPRGFDEINQAKRAGFFGWPYFIADNRPYADYDFTAEILGPRFDPAHPENVSPNNTGRRHLPPAQPAWIYYPYGASDEFPELDAPGGRTACAGPVYHFDPALDSRTKFPAYYDDCLFAFEWARHWIKTLRLGADSELVEIRPFLGEVEFKRPVDMEFGPEGSLYLLEYGTTWGSNADSRLVRIDYILGNRPPVARASATGNVGREPLEVALSSRGTFDKDEGDRLAYAWRVAPSDAVLSRDPEATLTFDEPGVFTVVLSVTDAEGARSTATVPVLVGNDPPEIRFSGLEDGAFFDPERPVAWSVEVFDEEDGDTESNPFDLAPRIVVSATLDPPGLLGQSDGKDDRDPPGLMHMKRSDCFNCHTLDRKIVGPALHEIAERYRGDAAAIETAAARVITGSSGVWSDVPMLPHAQHTLEETRLMVRWITSLESRKGAHAIQVGLAGKVDANELAPGDACGLLVLEATYTDTGGGPVGPLGASARVTLRSRRVEAEHYTSRSGTRTLESKTASSGRFIGAIDHENYLRFAAVDLADVGRIALEVSSAGGGGTIELRSGALDGALVGSIDVVPNGAWEEWYELSLPVAYSGAPCDVYVRFLNPERRGGLMNLDRVTFHPPGAGAPTAHDSEHPSEAPPEK